MSRFNSPSKRSGKDMTDNLLKEIAILEHELEQVSRDNQTLRQAIKFLEKKLALRMCSSCQAVTDKSQMSTTTTKKGKKALARAKRLALEKTVKMSSDDVEVEAQLELDKFPTKLEEDFQRCSAKQKIKLELIPAGFATPPPSAVPRRKLWKDSLLCEEDDWKMHFDNIYKRPLEFADEIDSGRDSERSPQPAEVTVTVSEGSSQEVPTAPCDSFESMNLKAKILALLSGFGFTQPSILQAWALSPIISGQSVVIAAPSGKDAGKQLINVIGSLEIVDWRVKQCQVVILMARRDRALEVFEFIESCAATMNYSTHLCIGGTAVREDTKKVLQEQPQIICGTPGRVLDIMNRLKKPHTNDVFDQVKLVVLGQGSSLLNLQFNANVEGILQFVPENVQTIIATTEMTNEVAEKANSGDFLIFQLKATETPRISISPVASAQERRMGNKEERLQQIALDKSEAMQTIQHFYRYWTKPGEVAAKCLSVFETFRDSHAVIFSDQFGIREQIERAFSTKPNLAVLSMPDKTKGKLLRRIMNDFINQPAAVLIASSLMVKNDNPAVKHAAPLVINADVAQNSEIFFRRCQVANASQVTLIRSVRQHELLQEFEQVFQITVKELIRFPPIAWNKPIQLPKD